MEICTSQNNRSKRTLIRLKPAYIKEIVTDIDINALKDDGIKGFIFDLDNTIMAPKSAFYDEKILEWLNGISKDFKIAVVSNNSNQQYMDKVREISNFPIYANAGKPSRKKVLEALKEMELLPEQVAMVGDRPLTDIWVGVRLGMTTILVDPLMKHKENKLIKFLRRLERMFISEK